MHEIAALRDFGPTYVADGSMLSKNDFAHPSEQD
jgi:hypothetical protein